MPIRHVKGRPGDHAFTLLELMVSIGIIALLLALFLPALAGTRSSASSIKSLSNARQLAQIIQLYTEQDAGRYPALIEGRFYPTTGRYGGMFSFPYWQVWSVWTGVTFDLLPYDQNVNIYISPGSSRLREPGTPWPSSYVYSTSFVGAPSLWSQGAQPDPKLMRSAKTYEVQYPSSKALLWDAELGWVVKRQFVETSGDLLNRTPVILADLSGSQRIPADARPATPNPFEHSVSLQRLHNTSEGVRGLDY